MLKPYYETKLGKLYCGDCLEILPELEPVDLVLTDPPYGIGFMGKTWDKTGIANNIQTWEACLKILKPGGHLLSFGGARTYHRMACAIEDAGFEIRDMIEWVYGSGFPKSLNIGKAVDKLQRNKREELGISKNGSGVQPSKLKNHAKGDTGIGYMDGSGKRFKITKGNSEWEGWGTALKPAHEPICLARKPIEKRLTVAQNCLKWGTGGINIDGSRIKTKDTTTNHSRSATSAISKGKYGDSSAQKTYQTTGQQQGRFPANLIHDGSDEVINCFPNSKGQQGDARGTEKSHTGGKGTNCYGEFGRIPSLKRNDSGNASRFFKSIIYRPKASRKERGKGNNHPTVKPVALIKHLITMLSKPQATILDPFMGSGTTAVACEQLNRRWIGIEISEKYCEIAAKRLRLETQQLKLF